MHSTTSCDECPYSYGMIAICTHPALDDADCGIPGEVIRSGSVMENCPLGTREVIIAEVV